MIESTRGMVSGSMALRSPFLVEIGRDQAAGALARIEEPYPLESVVREHGAHHDFRVLEILARARTRHEGADT